MRVPLHRLAGIGAAALFLATAGTAQAQGKGHDKDHDKDHGKHAQVQDDDRHRSDQQHDPRIVNQGAYDHRYDQSRQSTPPGLAKKPGGMPPGQYKKLYNAGQGASVLSDVLGRHGYHVVRTADAGDSRYVYYRDPAGTMHRATVTPSGERLRFTSVPRALLEEINGRLY